MKAKREAYRLNQANVEFCILLALDWTVYVADEKQSSSETNSSKHEKEGIANASHVTKEEWGLHETWHVWSGIIVIQAVAIDEQAGWSTTNEWPRRSTYVRDLTNTWHDSAAFISHILTCNTQGTFGVLCTIAWESIILWCIHQKYSV